MDKEKKVKTITIILAAVVIGFIIWKIILYPLIDFYKKEKQLTKAGEEYFERNTNLKPNEDEVSTVTLETLIKQKYIVSMRTANGKKGCDFKNSWVKVKRKEGKYTYITNLQCGAMKSTVDNEGPTIKLKGKEEIEIEKGTKYTDEGIESLYDNTDGKMNVKDVIVSGKVNTNEIGTYKIKYEATDSLENKTSIERTVKVIQTLNKIVKDNTEKKVYEGENPNNYIEFSNMLFRIVRINDDGSIKIVSSEPVGVVNYKDINEWLNEYFYSHLTDKAKKYIVEKDFCSSKITDKKIKTSNACDKKIKQKVGLLSAKDYTASVKDEKSYLYPVNSEWTSDYENDKKGWTISTSGVYKAFDINDNYSLYPSLNLKKGIKITKGSGTKDYPYEFSKVSSGKAGDLINTRYTGEYVSYAGTLYRIIDGNDKGNAKVMLMTEIHSLESHLADPFDEAVYNPKAKGNIGYYLENKVSKIIKTDIFVKKEIEVPIYDNIATYSGKKITKNYKVKLSAPNMYEMFGAVQGNCWLINSSKKKNINYMVDMLNNVKYKDNSQLEINLIKFTGYLDKDITILSGKGTINNPYILQK